MSKGFFYTFLASIGWAFSIIIARYVLKEGENAYNIAFWTSILAAPYWLHVFFKQKTEFKSLVKKDYLILLGMGLIGTVGTSITEAFAIQYSPAMNYAFLMRSVILFTIIFAYLFLGEKLTAKKIILAGLILTGAYLLTTNGQLISFSKGDVFTLAEAALVAFGNNILGKMATNRMGSDLSASGGFLFGLIPLAGIAFFNHAIAIPKSFFLILVLTVLYMLGIILRFKAYKIVSATFVTMVYSFTPVFVSIMAVTVLGEAMLTTTQIIGGLLIITAGIATEKLKIK